MTIDTQVFGWVLVVFGALVPFIVYSEFSRFRDRNERIAFEATQRQRHALARPCGVCMAHHPCACEIPHNDGRNEL